MLLSICTSSLEKCLLKAFGYLEIGLSCYCWVVDVPVPGEILRLWDWGRLAVISQLVVCRSGKWVRVCLTFKRQQALSPALGTFCLVFAVANCVCVWERENVRYCWEKIEREREKTDRETESIWDERMRKRSLTWLWLFNKTPTLEGHSHGKPFQSFWFLPINFQTLWLLLWTSKKFTREHSSH